MLKELSKEEDDTDSSEEMLMVAEDYEHRAIGKSRLVVVRIQIQTDWQLQSYSSKQAAALLLPKLLIFCSSSILHWSSQLTTPVTMALSRERL